MAAHVIHRRDLLTKLSHASTLSLLALVSLRLGRNLRYLRLARLSARQPAGSLPRVSVLVPARNEAESIVSCISSLLHQRYPHLEVLVLDDNSSDGTSEQLDALAGHYPQLTVIRATGDPPSGWNGKSYACHRLAQHATGDWLLFTDADTIHAPTSVAQGITHALALNAQCLSAFPYQRTVTWSERIMVSFIVDFIPLISLNLAAIWHGESQRILANGQYLLVHADTYHALGGHARVAQALVDDFALARQFYTAGYTLAMVDGTSMLDCRMYDNFRNLWNGFSKNILMAISSSTASPRHGKRSAVIGAPLFAWCYASLFIFPFFRLLHGKQRLLAILEICWLFLVRVLVGRNLGRPPGEVVTTPIAAWGVMALGIAALFSRWRRRPVVWKGRIYGNQAS